MGELQALGEDGTGAVGELLEGGNGQIMAKLLWLTGTAVQRPQHSFRQPPCGLEHVGRDQGPGEDLLSRQPRLIIYKAFFKT